MTQLVLASLVPDTNPDYPEAFHIPDTTSLNHRDTAPLTTVFSIYPGLKATRNWNIKHMSAAKSEVAAKLRRKIDRRITSQGLSSRVRARLLSHLLTLRPPRQYLKEVYIASGTEPEVARMLIDGENYEVLPAVRLTAEQFEELRQYIMKQEVY